jgi:hypothetical protein
MKKIYFSFLCCLIGLLAPAQNTFAPLGAEWWYYSDWSSSKSKIYFLLQIQSSRDTIIDGHNCRILQQTAHTKTSQLSIPFEDNSVQYSSVSTEALKDIYLYQTTDTIYI